MRLELYKDKAGEWRWHLIEAQSGKIVADSAEGYKNRKDCLEMAESILSRDVASIEFVIKEDD